jgi:hypothetical protein
MPQLLGVSPKWGTSRLEGEGMTAHTFIFPRRPSADVFLNEDKPGSQDDDELSLLDFLSPDR